MHPIEQACYWMTTSHSAPEPSLQSDLQSDIAIIGGGFTGLWTALFIKELDPSCDVALLESETVGYGGSGRNAGILGETLDHSHSLAVAHFGMEEAQRLVAIGRENIRELAEFLTTNRIDAEFEPTGRLFVALTTAQLDQIERSIKVEQELGVQGTEILNAEQARAEIHSPLYFGGASYKSGGILNPVKLVHGLKQLALQLGIQVYERSPVKSFENAVIQVENGGSLCAHKIVLATDAYTHHLYPKLLKYFIPLYDYIVVSEPLSDAHMERIGWRHRQGVTDGRTFFNYYRLTKDNRVLWGTSEAMYYRPNRVEAANDHSEAHYTALRRSFIQHFPQLADLKFPFAWGGPIASTTRLTPFFGSLEKGRVLYGLGYTGHGIGSTRVAGKILAHLALEKHSELLELSMVRKKPFPYPPEPLRSVAVRAVTHSLRRVDEGKKPNLFLALLNKLRIGFSS